MNYSFYLKPTGFCILVILLTWVFHTNLEISEDAFNMVAAVAGLFIVGAVFLIGPLSRYFPNQFCKYRAYRKFLGLFGFGLILIHVFLSLVFAYHLDVGKMVNQNPKALGFYSAVIAFFIFLLMSITSTDKAIKLFNQKLGGYNNWKLLQTTGYIAMSLALLHFLILETNENGFSPGIIGLAVFVFSMIVIAARIVVMIHAKFPAEKTFSEHLSCPHPELVHDEP